MIAHHRRGQVPHRAARDRRSVSGGRRSAERKRVIRAASAQIAQSEKPRRITADATVSHGAMNAADVTAYITIALAGATA